MYRLHNLYKVTQYLFLFGFPRNKIILKYQIKRYGRECLLKHFRVFYLLKFIEYFTTLFVTSLNRYLENFIENKIWWNINYNFNQSLPSSLLLVWRRCKGFDYQKTYEVRQNFKNKVSNYEKPRTQRPI